jgi:hypothetical protein
VVTLVSGNASALIATETIRTQSGAEISHAIVAPSILLTNASVLVPVGPATENTTAIAIANPSTGSGSVNLVFTDGSGGVVLNSTVVLGPLGQFSKFVNELFSTQPAQFSTPLLLTVSAEIPVALVAFNFRDGIFTSIPLTSLSFPTPVPVQPLSTPSAIVTVTPTLSLTGIPLTPLPPSTSSPSFGLGVIPPTPIPTMTVTPPVALTGTPTPVQVTPVQVTPVQVTPVQVTPVQVTPVQVTPVQSAGSIGGGAAFVFPQVVTGGGWSTEIAVGNTSTATQSIRIDFFAPNGAPAGSFTNVSVPPLGVVFLSADLSGTNQ